MTEIMSKQEMIDLAVVIHKATPWFPEDAIVAFLNLLLINVRVFENTE